ncbi:MAG: diguanylate cyclase [Desulforhopalus sp.]
MEKIQTVEQLIDAKIVPEPSGFSLDLIRLGSGRNAHPEQFLNTIDGNTRFSSNLLGYANSISAIATSPVPSIAEAVINLGNETVATLSLFYSLLAQYQHGKCLQFDYKRFWQQSLAMGTVAKALAENQKIDSDKLFVYGALAHIGELALATAHPNSYGNLLRKGYGFEKKEQEERKLFGLTSSELTWKLLIHWQLPEPLTRIIQEYGEQRLYMDNDNHTSTICDILHLSAHIARICLLELPLTNTFAIVEKHLERQDIPFDQFGPFFDGLVVSWQKTCDFYKVPVYHCPRFQHIKTINDSAKEIDDNKPPPLTFLAADDDPMTLIYLKKMLARENRTLLTAENGIQALEMAAEHRPHLLITDWRMPGMNGIDLCRTLRKKTATQHMYIIMLTCNETEDELVQAFDAGADDYIVKPFTPKVLQARISSGERLILHQQTIHRDRETIQQYAARLATANQKLQNMAMTDFLTGLPNRRNALLRLKNLVAETRRYGEPLSCLMIDIDNFKNINDTYGHDCGDIVLKQLSKLLEEKARSYDIVSRWGGEEFLIICARSGPTDSSQLAERLRRTVEEHTVSLSDEVGTRVTISVGIATWSPDLQNEDELIKEADTLLYLAKKNGRNRVEAAAGSITRFSPR